jgi:hypothetical protein
VLGKNVRDFDREMEAKADGRLVSGRWLFKRDVTIRAAEATRERQERLRRERGG